MKQTIAAALPLTLVVGCSALVGDFTFYDPDAGLGADAACATMCSEVSSPRPIAPLSTAMATSRRPTFRWELAPGSDGARLQICRDRACTEVLHVVDVVGDRGAPPADLPTGVVFWRLFGRNGSDVGAAPSPTWQVSIGARTAPVNTSWGTTLDVNGDGFADVLVSAPIANLVFVYLGGSSGVDATPERVTTLIGPDGGGFGTRVASAGDVNGDGFSDVLIGASDANSRGRSYLYFGGPDGLSTSAQPLQSEALIDVNCFGCSLTSAGDVNGDGFADVAVGASSADREQRGQVYLYLGSASGLTSDAQQLNRPPEVAAYDNFGTSIASGDVDGNGFADLIVGATRGGRVYLYLGGPSGPASTSQTIRADAEVGSEGLFGSSVASGGDTNGDGFADVIVGAPGVNSNEGRAYVYLGGSGGLFPSFQSILRDGEVGSDAYFGYSAALSDMDGDGFADAVVGAPGVNANEGRAYVYRGGLVAGLSGPSPVPRDGEVGPGARFGRVVASAGDVDGNRLGEILVGAPGVNSERGRAYAYFGLGLGGLSPTIQSLSRDADVGPSAWFGFSVASAGEVQRPLWVARLARRWPT